MKKIIFKILLIALSAVITSCGKTDTSSAKNVVPVDSTVTITISAVGDLMCHSVQYNYARVAQDSFDFFPVYREIQKYFNQSDFLFGNLETVMAGRSKGYSGYPFFNTPDDYAFALKQAGFDLLTTTNNHSLDKGEQGLIRTIEVLNKNNVPYNGTFISQKDRDSIRIFDIKGIKVALLAYTYGTNGIPIPKGKNYLVNLIDYGLIKSDIKKSKENRAEIILVHFHFGEEYKREPNKYQKDVVDSTIKYGADIIIGAHPHVIQPAEYFKTNNGNLDSGIVAYSLGNFISNQQWRYSDAGVILNISITKNFTNDSLNIFNVSFVPTWVYKGNAGKGNEYIILPSHKYEDSSYSFLSKSDREKMREAFFDTKEILKEYSQKLFLVEE